MNFKTTLVLLVLLVALGSVLFIVRNKQSNEPETPTAKKLIDIDQKDVSKIIVTPADGKKIVLEQSGMNWKLTEPINAAADNYPVESLLTQLTDMKSRGVVDASGADSQATGLDKPRYVVELDAKNGKSATVKVGERSAVGGNVYVIVDNDKPRMVSSELSDQLEKPYTDFRQKKLASVAAAEIKQIEITKPDAPKIVLQKNGENWEMTEPQKLPADSSEVSNLTFAISSMNANEFVDAKDIPPFLLPTADPKMTVFFSTTQPSTQPTSQPATKPAGTTITFGGYENVMKKNVYVAVSEPQTLAKVAASSMESFDKKPLDLRDKDVVKIAPANVESISIETNKPATTQPTTKPAETTTLTIVRNKEAAAKDWHAPFITSEQKDAMAQAATQPTSAPSSAPATQASTQASTEPSTQPTTVASTEPSTKPAAPPPPKWKITSDPKGAADEPAVEALLSQLQSLRAEKFLEKSPTTQPADQYTLTVTTTDGTSHTIHITDPGGSQNPIGEYNGATFELSRFFLEKLTAKFEPGAGATPTTPPSPGLPAER
jgi:hypothetical protein